MSDQETSQFPTQRVYWFVPLFVFIITFLIYLPTLAPTITWQYGADSGELAAAVAMLDSTPTPAYPTYILLGRAWSALPFGGDVAYRLNLLSAVAAALAAAFCASTILLIATSPPRTPSLNPSQLWEGAISPLQPSEGSAASLPFVLGALLGGLALALAPLTWAQATITEVYALGLAFVSFLSYLLILWHRKNRTFVLLLASLIAGLSVGVLPQLLLLVPCALGLFLRRQAVESRKAMFRQLMLLLLAFTIGASTYLYLPLEAIMQPQADWGLKALDLMRIPAWLAGLGTGMIQLGEQLSWLGLLPALLGTYFVWRINRRALAYLLSLVSLTLLFQASPTSNYLMPALYAITLLMGVGFASAFTTIQQHYGMPTMALFALLITSLISVRSMILAPHLDLSHDYSAILFAEEVFLKMPPNAIVVSERDESTSSLWYQQAIGKRQDVVIIDNRLLSHDWYQRHLIKHYPTLDPAALRPGELSKLGRPIYMLIEPVEEDRLLAFLMRDE